MCDLFTSCVFSLPYFFFSHLFLSLPDFFAWLCLSLFVFRFYLGLRCIIIFLFAFCFSSVFAVEGRENARRKE